MTLPVSSAKLVTDLEQKPRSFDRDELIRAAKRNRFHDFLSQSATPIYDLVGRLQRLGYDDLAQKAMNGEYDATKEEADAWAASPEGQRTFAELTKGKRSR